jgi:hypothetical protein
MASAVSSPFPLLVVTPTLGRSPWLAQTVESVARLSCPCLHVLVAPKDAVAELASRFPRTQVMPEPGGGMYAAINAGLAANESWRTFTYINDDDLLLPPFARLIARVNADRPQIVYGGVKLIRTNGRRAGAIPISSAPSLNRLLYAQRIDPVYQHGTVVTRPVVAQLGGFDPSLQFCGDSEFLARACVAGVPFVCATRREVAAFRLRAGQLTKNLPVMLAEHHRVHAMLHLPQRVTARHRWARLIFRAANASIYLERIARHGFIGFGEVLARVE